MLTLHVYDPQLETRLTQRAQATGKSTEQLANELLANALEQLTTANVTYPQLDPHQHSRTLQFDVDPATDEAPAFEHVADTAEYARALRKNAWKR